MNLSNLLNTFLTRPEKIKLFCLALFSFVVSLLETICLSAIMPFLFLAIGSKHSALSQLQRWLPAEYAVTILGVALLVACVLRALGAALFTHWLQQFSQGIFKRLGCKIFENYLRSEYRDYVSWNSTAVLKMITNDSFHVGLVVSSILQLLAELFVIVAMYCMLLWVSWKATLLCSALLLVALGLLIYPLLQAASYYGERKGYFWRQVNQIFQEGFGNFKFIRLLGAQQFLTDRFNVAGSGISQAYARYFTVQSYPRLVLETAVLVLLVGSVLVMVPLYGSAAGPLLISTLSLYGIAFYRLVPAINRLVAHYGQMNFSLAAIGNFEEKLVYGGKFGHELAEQSGAPPRGAEQLMLSQLSFGYEAGKLVLRSIDLTISRGERVAIIGKSGAGKSTLIDIILGFNAPTQGTIEFPVWHKNIGYIPQQIYLFDGTVADNVTFGRPYQEEWLISCLRQAQIYDFLLTKNGLQTYVGEGGVQLSGGQKQRIALARALYGDPELLVLDEATSALDKETEKLVLDDIFAITNKTLLIVTHRTEMLGLCDTVYEIIDGHISLVRTQHAQTKAGNFDAPSA